MQVLLVDDEMELVSTLAERLEYRGIRADWAVTPEEAMAKLAKKWQKILKQEGNLIPVKTIKGMNNPGRNRIQIRPERAYHLSFIAGHIAKLNRHQFPAQGPA